MKIKITIAAAVLIAVILIIILILASPSETQRAAAVRKEFTAAFRQNDYSGAAEAANEYSRLTGRTLTPALTFEETFPIGSTKAYPLDSLEISGDFIRRQIFYHDVVSSVTAGTTTEEEKILAVFDWLVTNVWPPHSQDKPSGRNPENIAMAGTGTPQETGWLFCTVLNNAGIDSMLATVDFNEKKEPWCLTAVRHGEVNGRWLLFAPDKGLPLVTEDGSCIATVKDLFAGSARVPGEKPVELKAIKYLTVLLAYEAQSFLPAAGDLEKLLSRNGRNLRCHTTVDNIEKEISEINSHFSRVIPSNKEGVSKINRTIILWPYPFHLKNSESSTAVQQNSHFVKARSQILMGRYTQALKMLDEKPGTAPALLVTEARLGSGDYGGVLSALDGFEGKGRNADRAAYIGGKALAGLGRNTEAGGKYKEIAGPRRPFGAFFAGKIATGEKPIFRIEE